MPDRADCGWMMNGVGLGTRFEGTLATAPGPSNGNCDTMWTNSATWSPLMKQQMQSLALASMDAFRNHFLFALAARVLC